MELFTQLFGDLLAFVYHCFDRIVIYGYLSGLARPEQMVHFFRQVVGVAVVDKEVLSRRTADYQAWVEASPAIAFLAVDDVAALQAAADKLSPQIIRQRLDYWTLVLGSKFSTKERKQLNLSRFYAIAQIEYCPLQLLLDEAVAVEVVGGLEREERGHPHHHRAQGFIAEVEVVVREAAALAGEDPVIWILGLLHLQEHGAGAELSR
jgi:hypothetical protein